MAERFQCFWAEFFHVVQAQRKPLSLLPRLSWIWRFPKAWRAVSATEELLAPAAADRPWCKGNVSQAALEAGCTDCSAQQQLHSKGTWLCKTPWMESQCMTSLPKSHSKAHSPRHCYKGWKMNLLPINYFRLKVFLKEQVFWKVFWKNQLKL